MSTGACAVLVTGARGALGRSITQALVAKRARPLFLASRGTGAPAEPSGPDVRWLRIDLTDERIVLPEGIDVVVHAAGEKRDVAGMQAVNHRGARRLAEAAARAGVRRFVHISSVGVYGAGHRAGLIGETAPHRPRNAYEASKEQGENAVREACAAASLECVVLQPTNVIAPVDGEAWPLLGFLSAIRRGRLVRFDRDDAWLNYVAVEDVAAAVAEVALGPSVCGTFIVSTPERLGDVVAWAADALRVPEPRHRWPAWAGHLACQLSGLAGHLLHRPGLLDRERLRELTGTTRFDGTALRHATGLSYPKGVKAMLAALVERYEREGRL